MTDVSELRKALVGTWKLRSFTSIPVGLTDPVEYPLGKEARGYVTWTNDGFVSAHMMNSDRSPYSNPDVYNVSPDDAAEAARQFLGYAGTFEISLEDGMPILRHSVEVALVPNWVGQDQVRQFTIEGDQLSLSPHKPWPINGKLYDQVALWDRVGKN